MEHTILSIDAWADADKGWYWNDTRKIGCILADEFALIGTDRPSVATNRRLLDWLRRNGYLVPSSAGRVAVEIDDTYATITVRSTGRPIMAIYLDPI